MKMASPTAPPAGWDKKLTVTQQDMSRMFKEKSRKAAGLYGVSGCILRTCTDQLAPVHLKQCMIPRCFKNSLIVPASETQQSTLPTNPETQQFAYRLERSKDHSRGFLLHKTPTCRPVRRTVLECCLYMTA